MTWFLGKTREQQCMVYQPDFDNAQPQLALCIIFRLKLGLLDPPHR